MRKELDEALCNKYPEIFRDRFGDKRTTCMCWGFECGDGWYNIIDGLCSLIQHHIDCSRDACERNKDFLKMREAALAGDWSVFDEYYGGFAKSGADRREKQQADVLKEPPEWRTVVTPVHQVVATQVKEKFGTLRFYYDGGDSTIDGMVWMAEEISARTCDVCGNVGKSIATSGWLSTRCEEHTKKVS